MRFGVLGPLAVWAADGTAVAIPGVKVRALLCALLVREGQPVPSDRLVDELWGEALPGNPTGALQAKVSQLRRVLGAAKEGARVLVEAGAAGYRLRADPESVDAGRFAALTARARERTDPRSRATALADALALWRGPAYADVADEEFARAAITRLEEERLTAVEELAEVRLELGEHVLLVGELGDAVARHPLRERLRAAQLRALYRAGRQGDALESYRDLREQLVTELGVDPSPELTRLHQAILEQDPELAPAVPSGPTRGGTNLPAAMATGPDGGLVGRATDVEEARALLDTNRLVTLTGPGGVGKTSLAVETARAASEGFGDGAWIVELAARHPPSDAGTHADADAAIAGAIAAVLGIRQHADASGPGGEQPGVAGRLADALRGKQILLILDNCEHVVTPVAALAERLLAAAPGLVVLVTSREPLGLASEVVRPVSPLDLPPADAGTPVLERSGAVRLFVTRASAADPGFTLTADNGSAVAAICHRLDGIPLALELAATRVRALGPHELACRLDDRFRLLAAGHRTAPARQRTLRAMIDWSWELLSGPERAVLRRLAVHADGCALDAAETVCAGGDVDRTEVLDLLARLVDRSLVVAADSAGERRYRLLESVAAYCVERLDDAAETVPMHRAHAEYYADIAERAAPHLRGPDQREWLRRLDAETANLRHALDTATAQGAAHLALRLVNAQAWYWFLRGRHPEARRALTAALEVARSPAVGDEAPEAAQATADAWLTGIAFMDYRDADPDARRRSVLARFDELDDPAGLAHAQWLIAFAMLGSGEMSVSERLATEAHAGFRALGDRWGIAAALSVRAHLAIVRGDLDTARRDSTESSALFGQLGDHWGQLYPTRLLGLLAEIGGDYESAARSHGNALRIAERLGLWPSVSEQLASLGRLSMLSGDFATAAEYHQRALRVAQEQAYGSGAAFAANGLALADRRQGHLDLAEERMRELLDWNRRTSYLPGVALALAELGFVAEQRGDADAAHELHTAGLTAARETGDPRAVALALEGLAGVATLTARHDRAAQLLGAAAAARESVGAPLPPAERGDVDRITVMAQAGLGRVRFDTELRSGREYDIAELVE